MLRCSRGRKLVRMSLSPLSLLRSFSQTPHIAKTLQKCQSARIIQRRCVSYITTHRSLQYYTRLKTMAMQRGEWDSLYNVTFTEFRKLGGSTQLLLHQNSFALCVMVAVPDRAWKPWRFSRTPRYWWRSLGEYVRKGDPVAECVVRLFLEEVKEELGENASEQSINSNSSLTLIQRLAIMGIRVEGFIGQTWVSEVKDTDKMLFLKSPPSPDYWKSAKNRFDYYEHLRKLFGSSLEALYNVTYAHILRTGGARSACTYEAIMSAYPLHCWKPWNFAQAPKGWWDHFTYLFKMDDLAADATMREFISHIGDLVGVKKLEDWYRISHKHLQMKAKHRSISRLSQFGGLASILKKLYPDHPWKLSKFKPNSWKRSTQFGMSNAFRILFPDEDIIEEASTSTLQFAGLTNKTSVITFDVALPRLRIVAEFHGIQHYQPTFDTFDQQERDKLKKELCIKNNYTYVEVPYWWDGEASSLAASLQLLRPDLNLSDYKDGKPIPSSPPPRRRPGRPRKITSEHQ